MSAPESQTGASTGPRPVGMVQPTHEQAVCALAALEGGRLGEAEKSLDAIPESPMRERAWKLLLRGLIAIERMKLTEAEPLLLQASSLGLIDGTVEGATLNVEGASRDAPCLASVGDALRLAARALHHTGWVYRRHDRPEDAYRAHLRAYQLREQYGSFDELWEAAVQLGLDADVGRHCEDGQRWHRVAIVIAEKAVEEPERKRAMALTNLSASCTQCGHHDEAVAAARTARDCWRRYDIGAVTAAQADGKLGSALLKQGESLLERDERLAKPALDEAVAWLISAHESLSAFGPDRAAEVRLCLEQKDFAERLLASCGA